MTVAPTPTPTRAQLRRDRRAVMAVSRRRRSTELILIVMAVVITGAAYTISALGEDAEIPPGIVVFVLFLLGLLVCAHMVVWYVAAGADSTLLPVAALLHGIGFVMITRLDNELAGLQATWSMIAILAFVGTLVVVQRASDLARYQWTFFAIGAGLLMLPMVPGVGQNINGARIWVSIGPINFQPGEFAKIALAIFFAAYLAERRELIAASTWKIGPIHLPEPRFILPILVAWGFSVVVMVGQRDLGSSLLFFTLFVVLMWVATEKILYLLIGAVLFTGAAYFSWSQFSHVRTRVDIWIDPWSRSLDRGYQIVQSLFGLADGGMTGTGLGRGNPNQVPEAQNDFIFAAIGEEMGLIGATAILISYLLIIGAGLRTAIRTERPFEKLLATGLTTIIGVQAFIIIGGVIKVVPLTGITLPFVSYGGSSLIANYILLALLLRVSDSAARRLGELPNEATTAERIAAWRLRSQVRRGKVTAVDVDDIDDLAASSPGTAP